jgi:predicted nucleotidyltransferase
MLIMHRSVASVLFPGYRRRVLGMLLLHPEDSLHGRELARRTGLPAGTLTRELKLLAEAGLLTCERRGNQLIYSANRESPIFTELAQILRKTSGVADVITEALDPLSGAIHVAFIFGSVARGVERAGSDVDLMVIGSADFGSVVEALYPAQGTLAREINPKIFSPSEWERKIQEDNAFVIEVLRQKKIFLKGGEHELAELSRH